MTKRWIRLTGVVAIAGVLSAGCGTATSHHGAMPGQTVAMATASNKAADLGTSLNALLAEHVLIAAVATSHALGGREAAFKGAAAGLDANSMDIARAIGSVYGPGAQEAFLPLWRRHIGFVVDYVGGIAAKDKAKQDKAVADLVHYTQDFGAFLSSANPNLPKAVVADLVKNHVLTLKDVIDAQAARDWQKVYPALRAAAAHMQMIADPLAEAIAKQFPTKYASR